MSSMREFYFIIWFLFCVQPCSVTNCWNFDIILTWSPNIIIQAESPSISTEKCWLIAENVRFLALMREMNLSAHRLSGKTSLLNGVQACSCKYYKFVIMSKIRIWMRQLASCMIGHTLASVNTTVHGYDRCWYAAVLCFNKLYWC